MQLASAEGAEAVQWAVDTIWKHDVGPQPATLRAQPNRALLPPPGGWRWCGTGILPALPLRGQIPQGVPFKFNLAQIPFAPRTRKRAHVSDALGLPILRTSKTPDEAYHTCASSPRPRRSS